MINIVNKIILIMFMVLNVFTNLVSANIGINPYEEDINYYKQKLNKDPYNLKILNNLASIYLKLNYYNEANVILLKIIHNKKHESQKKYKAALHTSGRNNKYFPNIEYARAHNLLGLYFIKKKEFERAVIELNIALKITPDSPKIQNNLGLAYKKIAAEKLSKLSIKKKNDLVSLETSNVKKFPKLISDKKKSLKNVVSKVRSIGGVRNDNKTKLRIENTNVKKNISDSSLKHKTSFKEGGSKYDFKSKGIANGTVENINKTDNLSLEKLIPIEIKNGKMNEFSKIMVPAKNKKYLPKINYEKSKASLKKTKGFIVNISRDTLKEKTNFKSNSNDNLNLENVTDEKGPFIDRYSNSLNDWIFDEDK
jgi:hypothetical protein